MGKLSGEQPGDSPPLSPRGVLEFAHACTQACLQAAAVRGARGLAGCGLRECTTSNISLFNISSSSSPRLPPTSIPLVITSARLPPSQRRNWCLY